MESRCYFSGLPAVVQVYAVNYCHTAIHEALADRDILLQDDFAGCCHFWKCVEVDVVGKEPVCSRHVARIHAVKAYRGLHRAGDTVQVAARAYCCACT